MSEAKREVWLLLEADQLVSGIHPAAWCSGDCVVHAPTSHSLHSLPLGFDTSKRSFFRTCRHGKRHQDPDERSYWANELERSAGKRTKSYVMAMTKLADWECPNCLCACCDITRVLSS